MLFRSDALSIGDRVATANGFSPIYAFAHRDPTAVDHLRLSLSTGHVLELTAGHLVYALRPSTSHLAEAEALHLAEAIPAGDVQQGDALLVAPPFGAAFGNSTSTSVRSELRVASVVWIESVRKAGRYTPFTADGNILVNGVLASVYHAGASFQLGETALISPHATAHLALAPLRQIGRAHV